MLADLYAGVDMTKVMFGSRAIHVPLNLIVQRVDNNSGKVTGVFQTSVGTPLLFGAKNDQAHVLILGDAIIRPGLAYASNHLVGTGFSGIAMHGFVNQAEWIEHGTMLLPPLK